MLLDLRTLALVLVSATCLPVCADGPRPDHPIVGTWTFTLPNSKCAETYRFRSDGTTFVTSGEEVAESEYSITPDPSPSGFYKWVDTVAKVNGKNDCSGASTPVGDKATNFVRFDGSGERLVICQTESLDKCFGPLRRVRGQGS